MFAALPQSLEVSVQRRQRRTQVMRHAGHGLPMGCHLGAFSPGLLLDALRHLGKGQFEHRDLAGVGR